MKSITLICIATILCTSIFARVQTIHAQPNRDEQARTLFLAGRTYFEQGEYELAREQFKRAYELSHRPALLINISLTAERTGDLEEAIESLEKYLREVPNAQDRETQEERLTTMRRRLERRRAEQPEQEPTAAPTPAAEAPQPLSPMQTPAPPQKEKVIPDAALASYIAGGVGLLMFGTFGTLTLVEDKNVKDKCGKTTSCEDSDLSKLHTYGIIADVGIGIAVAGAIAGTTFLLLHKKKARRDEQRAFNLSPYVGRLSGGATATVAF